VTGALPMFGGGGKPQRIKVKLAIALACGADNGRHCVRIDGGEAGEIA